MTFDSSKNLLISSSYDRTIRIWDIESGVVLRVLQGHKAGVTALAGHGGELFSAGRDDLARRYLTDYSRNAGMDGLRLGNALLNSIEARTEAIFGLRAPETGEMSKLSYDRVDCLP